MKERERLVGLVGKKSGGKDTVAAYLETQHDFLHVSSGDIIRKHVADHNLGDPEVRDVLIRVGKELRDEFGGDVLVKMALREELGRLVISGLRAIPEGEAIKAAGGEIWLVEAPVELRYEWAKGRGRIDENVSFEEFYQIEQAENASEDKNAQNILAMAEMADRVVLNSGSLEELYQQIDELMMPAVLD